MRKILIALLCVATFTACKNEAKDKQVAKKVAKKETKPGIAWEKNVDGVTFAQVKELAKKENKKIFLDFYTKWCGPKKYGHDCFQSKRPRRLLQ